MTIILQQIEDELHSWPWWEFKLNSISAAPGSVHVDIMRLCSSGSSNCLSIAHHSRPRVMDSVSIGGLFLHSTSVHRKGRNVLFRALSAMPQEGLARNRVQEKHQSVFAPFRCTSTPPNSESPDCMSDEVSPCSNKECPLSPSATSLVT